jgi:hypothetical protein
MRGGTGVGRTIGLGVKRFGGTKTFGGGDGGTATPGERGGFGTTTLPRLLGGTTTGAGTKGLPGTNVVAGTHLRLSASGFCPAGQHWPPVVAKSARQHDPFGNCT